MAESTISCQESCGAILYTTGFPADLAELTLNYLDAPESQAIGTFAGIEVFAAKPLTLNCARHYTKLGHSSSLAQITGVSIWSEDVDSLMILAVLHGHESIVRMCKDWGADINNAMRCAAGCGGYGTHSICPPGCGNEKIVRLCRELGGIDINGALAQAAYCGRENIVRLCWNWGANDFDKASRMAAIHGHHDIGRLCRWYEECTNDPNTGQMSQEMRNIIIRTKESYWARSMELDVQNIIALHRLQTEEAIRAVLPARET